MNWSRVARALDSPACVAWARNHEPRAEQLAGTRKIRNVPVARNEFDIVIYSGC